MIHEITLTALTGSRFVCFRESFYSERGNLKIRHYLSSDLKSAAALKKT